MKKPSRFIIEGLFDLRRVEIPIAEKSLILVGPNGVGKSSVTNIFYFFITRQWSRLLEYEFSSITLEFEEGQVLHASREEISGIINLDRALRKFSPSSRFRMHIDLLRRNGMLEELIADRPSGEFRERVASLLNTSERDVNMLRVNIKRRIMNDDEAELFEAPRQDLERKLGECFPGRTIYLPTYRRIERDLDEIFPGLEERVIQAGYRSQIIGARSAQHYVDLVSFGMEDVRATIKKKLNELRDYSLAQFNALSGLYLRDVIHGRAQKFSESQISSLSEVRLSRILSRVSEQILSLKEKALLRERILKISSLDSGPMEASDSYLAHYFTLLMNVSDEISKQEADIIDFVNVCNAYLEPSKEMVYDDSTFEIEIIDNAGRDIDLSYLSSGEKQVISLFSHIYLDSDEDQVVIIDEPELSLSVPWQKRFLPDIAESPSCQFLLAVTHSPFIYQNSLSGVAVDLRKFVSE